MKNNKAAMSIAASVEAKMGNPNSTCLPLTLFHGPFPNPTSLCNTT